MTALNDRLERLILRLVGLMFGLLVADVFFQVFSRNVLQTAFLWTLDVAQLLFTWCIFLGAAVALRRGIHYVVELVPARWSLIGGLLKLFADLAVAVVVTVMIVGGIGLAGIGWTQITESLPITRFWFYLPILLSGVAMASFLIEVVIRDVRLLTGAETPEP